MGPILRNELSGQRSGSAGSENRPTMGCAPNNNLLSETDKHDT